MELKHYLSTILKWWWLIALSTAVAAAFSYYASAQSPRIYQTATTLMVGQALQSPNPDNIQVYAATQLAQTYVQIVRRQPVMQAVVDDLKLTVSWEQVAAQTSVALIQGTQLIEIKFVDTNPQRAKLIADAIAQQVIAQSPTPSEKQQEEHRQFVDAQLKDLQDRIDQAKADIGELEKSIVNEVSARRIQDVQSQIAAKQSQINQWQATYAQLLTFYKGGTNVLSVIEPASVPVAPIAPRTDLNVMIAAAIGCLLAVGGAFLLEYLDDTIKTPEDAQRVANVSALGVIARVSDIKSPRDALVTATRPNDPVSEAYRLLRTNLQFSGVKNPAGSLLITSSSPGEGKSMTAANLAVSMAQSQKRIILVDTDLRRPSQHKIFGMTNKRGVTSLMLDETLALDDVLQTTDLENLRVLTSGPLPPNPAEVLNSTQMLSIINQLKDCSDMVIFDSPPVLAVADALILSGKLNSTLLVVDSGKTRADAVRRSIETLNKVNAKVVGVVLNKMRRRHAEAYSYYYQYYTPGGEPARKKGLFSRRHRTSAKKNEAVQ